MTSSRTGMNADPPQVDSSYRPGHRHDHQRDKDEDNAPLATSTSRVSPLPTSHSLQARRQLRAPSTTPRQQDRPAATGSQRPATSSSSVPDRTQPNATGWDGVLPGRWPKATTHALTRQITAGGSLAESVPSRLPGSAFAVVTVFLTATVWRAPDLRPPIAGLAPFGTDFSLLLVHRSILRATDGSRTRQIAHRLRFIFPSIAGNFRDCIGARTVALHGRGPPGRHLRRLHQPGRRLPADWRQSVPQRGSY